MYLIYNYFIYVCFSTYLNLLKNRNRWGFTNKRKYVFFKTFLRERVKEVFLLCPQVQIPLLLTSFTKKSDKLKILKKIVSEILYFV